MTIDPRVGFWVSLLAAIISAVVGATAELTDVVGPENSKLVIGLLIIANTVLNAVNAVLHAIPSPDIAASTTLKGAKLKQSDMYYLGPR